jgi:hypothetical protein
VTDGSSFIAIRMAMPATAHVISVCMPMKL